mmetsp:Transcript_14666/g.29403  ORF Transcript_14666/g.29403 Transcript_14666/m.29403 type:complete len:235 (-) Transcript_14666:515-1219(-)
MSMLLPWGASSGRRVSAGGGRCATENCEGGSRSKDLMLDPSAEISVTEPHGVGQLSVPSLEWQRHKVLVIVSERVGRAGDDGGKEDTLLALQVVYDRAPAAPLAADEHELIKRRVGSRLRECAPNVLVADGAPALHAYGFDHRKRRVDLRAQRVGDQRVLRRFAHERTANDLAVAWACDRQNFRREVEHPPEVFLLHHDALLGVRPPLYVRPRERGLRPLEAAALIALARHAHR